MYATIYSGRHIIVVVAWSLMQCKYETQLHKFRPALFSFLDIVAVLQAPGWSEEREE